VLNINHKMSPCVHYSHQVIVCMQDLCRLLHESSFSSYSDKFKISLSKLSFFRLKKVDCF